MKNRRAALAVGIASSLLVAGCGGGGSSSTPSAGPVAGGPTPSPTPTTATATLPAGGNTTFADMTSAMQLGHSFGFSAGLNQMVAQFAGGAASGDVDGDGDIDGDGDLDLLLGGLESGPTKLFVNDGAGNFTDATAGSGFDTASSEQTISMALGDYDGDGDLDVLMAHWGTPRDPSVPGETETLWRNDSSGGSITFTPASQTSGVAALLAFNLPQGVLGPNYDYTFAPSFADIDGDRDLDILMVSDFRGSRVLVNNGNGTFSGASFTPDDENGMGAAVGDYDNDGDFDWFVSSINGNRLFRNNGAASFARDAQSGVEPGGWGWGSCFADFNADGWLDIYQTNGWEAGKDPSASQYVDDTSRLWMNQGDGTFIDAADTSNMLDTDQGRGIVCDDFDNDGDVDVLLLTAEPQDSVIYWENQLANFNYLKVSLRGRAPNTQAIGAIVQLTISDTMQTRMVAVNSNFTSHNSATQMFGLGTHSEAGLRIIWPDGAETIVASAAANQTLTVDHPQR